MLSFIKSKRAYLIVAGVVAAPLCGYIYYEKSLIKHPQLNLNQDKYIVLIGRTGAGKSTIGNAILRQDVFKTGSRVVSTTRTVNRQRIKIDDKELHIIDTPGAEDNRVDIRETLKEIARVVLECPKGIDLILYVSDFRFTQGELNNFNLIINTLLQGCDKNVVIVRNWSKEVANSKNEMEEFFANSTLKDIQVFSQCVTKGAGVLSVDVNEKLPRDVYDSTVLLYRTIEETRGTYNPDDYKELVKRLNKHHRDPSSVILFEIFARLKKYHPYLISLGCGNISSTTGIPFHVCSVLLAILSEMADGRPIHEYVDAIEAKVSDSDINNQLKNK